MIKNVIPFLFLLSCNSVESNSEQVSKTNTEQTVHFEQVEKECLAPKGEVNTRENVFSIVVFFVEEQGWGYKILNNQNLFINQPVIPSLPGNAGFSAEKHALKTAEYIVYKLENGIFPPSITPEELDSLGVL